jgi:hypothetical protein
VFVHYFESAIGLKNSLVIENIIDLPKLGFFAVFSPLKCLLSNIQLKLSNKGIKKCLKFKI